ncbi:flagellar biosynthesis protein FlhF [Alicyclobacillus tolerans]|uniref:flagellar biosynthesis protein FlhF n=1 Tax=Alicyclobacillus tolerans TaxID=90970 RepID=UPI003B7D03CE
MMVKRYVVRDMPEALLRIRSDLGKDAVILSSKRIHVRKWLIWRSKRIEVMAAVAGDLPVKIPAYHPPALGQATAKPENVSEKAEEQKRILRGETSNMSSTMSMQSIGDVQVHSANSTKGITSAQEDTRQVLLPILDEMKKLTYRLQQLSSQNTVFVGGMNQEHFQLQQLLVQQGISVDTVREWMQESGVLSMPKVGDYQLLLQSFRNWFIQQFQTFAVPSPIQSTSRIVAFVGPTGVGKTTTIAKLAALHVLSGERKVGLITCDTYRIAAIEQLRTYAQILGIPLEVAESDAVSLNKAVDSLSHCDLLLMDTAGRNYFNQRSTQDVQTLLSIAPIDEIVLVLSLTSKAEDLNRLLEAFSTIPFHKFLFTKLDETSSYGVAAELIWKAKKPLSYITTGQNVPDDISPSTKDFVLKSVFGEGHP